MSGSTVVSFESPLETLVASGSNSTLRWLHRLTFLTPLLVPGDLVHLMLFL